MKVTQCISSIDKRSGGPSRSVPQLCNGLALEGVDTSLVYYIHCNPNDELLLPAVNNNGLKLSLQQDMFATKYAKAIAKISPDIIHLNTVWSLCSHRGCRWARKNNVPYVYSTHGTMEPFALQTKSLKKKIAMLLYQKNDLNQAVCLHATAMQEAENLRKLGYNNPIAVIPNGIDLSRFSYTSPKQPIKKRKLLFVSRIHRIKGIDMLIKAWNMLGDSFYNEWELDIVGNKQDEQYYNELVDMAQCGDVLFTGELWGQDLINKYNEADLYILPTHSENFGIVVAEALACGVPVITTTGAPWQVIEERKCGWWIEPTVDDIFTTLKVSLQKSEKELTEMGKRGRKLMEDEFSKESVARKTKEMYEWILGKADKPDFIFLK